MVAIPYAPGQIVRLVEKPGYLQGVTRNNEYVINSVHRDHNGNIYLKILGDDDRGHDLLSKMFRLAGS